MAQANTEVTTNGRDVELKQMLEERRRELVSELHAKMRAARNDSAHGRQGLDDGEISDVDVQEEIGFMLIQMKAETLDLIETALRRLDEATYGVCVECGVDIASARLRALPFAMRCKDCEDEREAVGRKHMPAYFSSPMSSVTR